MVMRNVGTKTIIKKKWLPEVLDIKETKHYKLYLLYFNKTIE